MNILYLLIPVAISMGLVGLVAFIWSVRSGQYEDLAGAAERVLQDVDGPTPQAGRNPKLSGRSEEGHA